MREEPTPYCFGDKGWPIPSEWSATQRERAKDTERKSSVLPQLNVLRTFCRPLTSQGPVFPVVLPPHYSLAIFVLASRAARSRCCFAFRTPPANIFIKHTPTLPVSPPLSPPSLPLTGVKYSSGVVVVGSTSRNERESPKNLFPAKSSFSLSIRASGGWDGSRHGDDIAGKTAGWRERENKLRGLVGCE